MSIAHAEPPPPPFCYSLSWLHGHKGGPLSAFSVQTFCESIFCLFSFLQSWLKSNWARVKRVRPREKSALLRYGDRPRGGLDGRQKLRHSRAVERLFSCFLFSGGIPNKAFVYRTRRLFVDKGLHFVGRRSFSCPITVVRTSLDGNGTLGPFVFYRVPVVYTPPQRSFR